jgi:hypothetical protein
MHKLKKDRKGIENLPQDKEKPNRTNSTFAIRTNQHSNPKLQKSYFTQRTSEAEPSKNNV